MLRRDGTLWCELGDGYTDKQLGGYPWKLADALRAPYYAGNIKREEDRVWLAAMIDGEGCIAIHRRPAGQSAYSLFEKTDGTTSKYIRTKDSFQPKVEITNTNLVLIERVIALTGEGNSNVKQEAGTFGRKQTLYRWTLTADKARAFLREIYPHLVAKQQEARLALGCPSSGDKATAAWEALKLLHAGSETTVDLPEPPSLYEGGWFLRSDIVWSRLRPNPMPESVTDRPTKSHSYVFLLSQSPRYFYDVDAIREPAEWARWGNQTVPKYEGTPTAAGWIRPKSYEELRERRSSYRSSDPESYGRTERTRTSSPCVTHPSGRNKRSVWTIPTQPLPYDHYAAYPEALVEPCIKAGTSERGCCPECGAPWVRVTQVAHENPGNRTTNGQRERTSEVRGFDARLEKRVATTGWKPSCECGQSDVVPATVLDCFLGSGTTALVARRLGRKCVGIDLSEKYCQIAAERLQQLSLLAETGA